MNCQSPSVAATELFGDATEVWYGMLTIKYDSETSQLLFKNEDDGFIVHRADFSEFDSVKELANEIEKQNTKILNKL